MKAKTKKNQPKPAKTDLKAALKRTAERSAAGGASGGKTPPTPLVVKASKTASSAKPTAAPATATATVHIVPTPAKPRVRVRKKSTISKTVAEKLAKEKQEREALEKRLADAILDAEKANKETNRLAEASKASAAQPPPPIQSKKTSWKNIFSSQDKGDSFPKQPFAWTALAVLLALTFCFVGGCIHLKNSSGVAGNDEIIPGKPGEVVDDVVSGVKNRMQELREFLFKPPQDTAIEEEKPKASEPEAKTSVEPRGSTSSIGPSGSLINHGNMKIRKLIINEGCCGHEKNQTETTTQDVPTPKAWPIGFTPDKTETLLDETIKSKPGMVIEGIKKLLMPGEGGTLYLAPAGGWRIIPIPRFNDLKYLSYVVNIGTMNDPEWVDPAKTDKKVVSYWIKSSSTEPIAITFQLVAIGH